MRSPGPGVPPIEPTSAPIRLSYRESALGDGQLGWALRRMPARGAVLAQRYQLEAPEDLGAPGRFWRARQLRLGRSVTVQLLDPAIVDDTVLLEAFFQEASQISTVNAPHVARVLDYGIDHELEGGVPFLVLAQLNGRTLARQLQNQPRLSLAQVARVVSHVALGLEALHQRGIVHRRLAPPHVFSSEEPQSGSFPRGVLRTGGDDAQLDAALAESGATTSLLFALDESFRESLSLVRKLSHQLAGGYARWQGRGAVRSSAIRSSADPLPTVRISTSRSSSVPAEPPRLDPNPYQSPEQLLGHGAVDSRSDLWSLAVVAFEALTGVPAFGGGSVGERLVRICTGEPNDVPAGLDLPAGFHAWFQRGVQRVPADRFASAREMSEAFLALLRG